MENWNIYWLEWRSDTEVALGINGKETVCLKKSEWTDDQWTFTNEKNPKGLKFILTMGAPSMGTWQRKWYRNRWRMES